MCRRRKGFRRQKPNKSDIKLKARGQLSSQILAVKTKNVHVLLRNKISWKHFGLGEK